jgi:hypothetical protein
MYKKNSTSYTPLLNAFFALMMALAAFNLLVMPSDLMVKLAVYGISSDHREQQKPWGIG